MSLTACGLDFFFFFFNSRQNQREALEPVQGDAVKQEAVVRKKVQGTSPWPEDRAEQVG